MKITFLSSPKKFEGPADGIQSRSIANWQLVAPTSRVLLYGSHPTDRDTILSLGAALGGVIETSQSGIPLFGPIVRDAAKVCEADIQIYLNCDILLPKHFVSVIEHCFMTFRSCLVIGQRIDLSENVTLSASPEDWEHSAPQLVAAGQAELHGPGGSDYFAFSRGSLDQVPQIIIGRGSYDNAIIAYCLREGIPVIDASISTLVFHQFHDYGHVRGGRGAVFSGADALENRSVVGSIFLPSLQDATHLLLPNGRMVRNWARGDWARAAEVYCRFRRKSQSAGDLVRQFGRLLGPVGWSKSKEWTIDYIESFRV